MKLSREESSASLIKKLAKIGYSVSRQKGSQIRLTRNIESSEHHLTIPNHDPIKIGTLSKILNDVARHLNICIEELGKLMDE